MDIRLKVDWGASPQAPPGKTNESPPPVEEFKQALRSARKEETLGEVAETEPNAQLQNLDPEKKETVDTAPLTTLAMPTEIDPAILAQIWSSQLALPNALGQPIALDISVLRATLPGDLQLQTSTETISLKSSDILGDKVMPSLTSAIVDAGTVTASQGLRIGSQVVSNQIPNNPQLLSKEVQMSLNVTSVKASSKEVLTQVASTNASASVEPAKAEVVTPIRAKDGIANQSSQAVANITVESTGSSQQNLEHGQSQNEDQNPNQEDGPQAISANVNNQVQQADNLKSDSPTFGRTMNSTERQAMVDSISRKIDELASRSVRNEVRIEMHPPDLGSVVINLRKDVTGLTATLNASNEPLRQALNDSRNDLAGVLADRNVGQVRIEVRGANADTMNLGQQQNQAQSNQQQTQQHHTKQASQNTELPIAKSKDAIDNPAPRRLATTLLDMEI